MTQDFSVGPDGHTASTVPGSKNQIPAVRHSHALNDMSHGRVDAVHPNGCRKRSTVAEIPRRHRTSEFSETQRATAN